MAHRTTSLAAAAKTKATTPHAQPKPGHPLTLVINLERRADRLAALGKLRLPFEWERLDAIDGRTLAWSSLSASDIHPDAVRDAQWAEREAMPTICRFTGSFSPHLTLGAVGTALSHRRAWEALLACPGCEYAFIMEDDLTGVADGFSQHIERLRDGLPRTWQICYLGFHESSGELLTPPTGLGIMEIPKGSCVTGLFAYLLHRRAAEALLRERPIFPLRYQIDVALSQYTWPPSSRFAVRPEGVLVTSPKSEVGKCDTDVQTLGQTTRMAHAKMPRSMLKL
jgi:GR25 family glycosyltransferase involved in LPS biosynthesis